MSDRETLVQWFADWLRADGVSIIGAARVSLRARLEAADREYADMCAEAARLRADTTALATRCDQKQEYIDQLTADKEALRKERKELRTQVEEARENHGAACKERDEALAELDGVRKERDQLRESLAWANDQHALRIPGSERRPMPNTETPAAPRNTEEQLVGLLRKACAIYRDASYQGHSSHWDSTMQHGAGCPACIRAARLRDEADAIMDQANDNGQPRLAQGEP